MDSYPGDFPFGIMDVVELLHLRIRRRQANSVYVDCPFCGDRRGKMNVNFVKNVWRCNYCDEHGGMLALYARLNNTTTSDAYWEIGEALCNDFHRERPNSGYEMAGNQQAGTGSPVSGTQTDLAGYERRGELKTVQQAERASGQEIHQTLSLLLAMLPLQPAHRNHLHSPKRGLSDEQIDRIGFKSTPPPFLCRSITERLMKQGCKVEGVPGFYLDDSGRWTMNFYRKNAGILIPAVGYDGMNSRLLPPIRRYGAQRSVAQRGRMTWKCWGACSWTLMSICRKITEAVRWLHLMWWKATEAVTMAAIVEMARIWVYTSCMISLALVHTSVAA